jgi:hypothetical protein
MSKDNLKRLKRMFVRKFSGFVKNWVSPWKISWLRPRGGGGEYYEIGREHMKIVSER